MEEVTTFFTQNGIPEYVLVWIFMIALSMTAVVGVRQIVGVKGLSTTATLLLGFALTATGAEYGLILFATALIATFVMRQILRNIRLLFLPKMGILLTGVVTAIIFIAPLIPYNENLQFPQAIFSFVIIILLMEQFASYLIERGPKKTFGTVLGTLALSLMVFFIASSTWLRGIVASYPIFVLAAVVASNFALGKWTGLRALEYIRFKDLIFK